LEINLMKNKQNLLIYFCPDLIKEWHPTKNNHLDIHLITYSSNKKVWWKCQNNRCGFEWQTLVSTRTINFKETGEITKCKKCLHRPLQGESLAELFPQKAKDWHPNENGDNLPIDFTIGSNFKAIWLCPTCNESYPMTIKNRTNGQSCPYCIGKKVGKLNNLEFLYPELAKEWHPSKNRKTPSEVYAGGNKRYYWICKICNEEYKTSIYEKRKSNKNGCPYCSGKKVGKTNNLEHLFPDLASEWHPTMNTNKPNGVTAYSSKKAYWQCPINLAHTYRATIYNRTSNSSGCPHCYNAHTSFWELRILDALKLSFPNILHRQTPFTDITKELDIFIPDLNIGIEVDGAKYHKIIKNDIEKNNIYKKKGIIIIRVRAIGLDSIDPCISNIHPHQPIQEYINDLIHLISLESEQKFEPVKVNNDKSNQELYKEYLEQRSLATMFPEITKEYDTNKNQVPPELITYGSNQNVYWRSKNCGHDWDAPVVSRTLQGQGCPFCSGKRVNESNCLATLFPDVAVFWDKKSNILTPNDVTAHSSQEVYWLCTNNKKKRCPKKSPVFTRIKSKGCAECFKGSGSHMKGKKHSIPIGESLASLYPEIVNLWDYKKNEFTPDDYTPQSNDNVSWICSSCNKPHFTEIRYKVRSTTRLCKSCSNKFTKTNNSYNRGRLFPVNYEESLEYLYPAVVIWWDSKRNNLTPAQVRGNSSKVMWWICPFCIKSHTSEVRNKVKSKTNGACKKCRYVQSL
jgi:Probable Zinc-ribbon domain